MAEPTLYVWRCEACDQVDSAAVVTDGSRYGLHRGVCGGQCLRIPVVPAEQLERAVEAAGALADAVRALDSYADLGGAPMERTQRADAALARYEALGRDA